uniref:Putative ovule protein n=1 Tax=Solanum chacoense TaxID=4108 RepID=A0A0V0H3H7_SOLCH
MGCNHYIFSTCQLGFNVLCEVGNSSLCTHFQTFSVRRRNIIATTPLMNLLTSIFISCFLLIKTL